MGGVVNRVWNDRSKKGNVITVTAAMTSPAYQCYAGAHLPITGQEVGLQEVELCIWGGVNDVREIRDWRIGRWEDWEEIGFG